MINLLEIRRNMEARDHYAFLKDSDRIEALRSLADDVPGLLKLVLDMKKALEFCKSALGDSLMSKKSAGKGISKEYLNEAIGEIDAVLDQIKS